MHHSTGHAAKVAGTNRLVLAVVAGWFGVTVLLMQGAGHLAYSVTSTQYV